MPAFRTMSFNVASWFRFMLAGACTSTETATDCLPRGRRSTAARDGSGPPATPPGAVAGTGGPAAAADDVAGACVKTTFSSDRSRAGSPLQAGPSGLRPAFAVGSFFSLALFIAAGSSVLVFCFFFSSGGAVRSAPGSSDSEPGGAAGSARSSGNVAGARGETTGVGSGGGGLLPSSCPRTTGAIDDADSIIPRISKSRRPMDSIPSLGTAPVDATPRE